MDSTTPTHIPASKLHPLLWIAGVSVTLFALVGIASLTGWLPSRSTDPAPQTATLVTAPAAAVPQAAAAPEAAAAPARPAPAARR